MHFRPEDLSLRSGARRSGIRFAVLPAALLALSTVCVVPTMADDSVTTATPTASPLPTATPTPRPVPTATHTPIPTVPARQETTSTAKKRRHRKQRSHGKSTPGPSASTPTPVAEPGHHKHRHKKHKRISKKPTPTPRPTATPVLNLNADDTIAPVTCNGPGKPVASHPFLMPPYRGWTSLVSYFDHDSPNYLKDGLMITATGAHSKPDNRHIRTDFPAYWNPDLRQYLDYDGHNGYDYNLSYQSVYAAAAGKVIFASMEYPTMPDHGYGNLLMIQHRGGYVTLYGHLSKFLVKMGQRVKRGQRIAISGNTGHSTGPHLHFTVFHNCTPTDPYGWAGAGPDPLNSYAGESSTYLWIEPPAIDNPLPGWPGTAALPAVGLPRMLLLKLPPTAAGSSGFAHALHRLGEKVVAALGGAKVARVDMLQGTVDTSASLTAAQILRIPGVVSITAPDVLDGARSDVLDALGRAALATRHRTLKLSKKGGWTGYLINYSGRTVLVGKGERGKTVDMRLSAGRGGAGTHRVRADPSSGAYVLDLGKLSANQQQALQHQLEMASAQPAGIKSVKTSAPARTQGSTTRSTTAPGPATGAMLALIAFLAICAGIIVSRKRLFAHIRPS